MFSDLYDEAWKALIKPEDSFFDKDLLDYPICPQYPTIKRTDFTVTSSDKHEIEATYYHPKTNPSEPVSIIIYLHTRGGNRTEGLFLADLVLPKIGLLLFDFPASGFSGGEFVSLGFKESKDVRLVIDEIKRRFKIKDIILWGRSMGAVAAILFASRPSNSGLVQGLVLDSPFSCFQTMVRDFVSAHKSVPMCLIDLILVFVLKTVKEKIGVDLSEITPLENVRFLKVPAFFLVAKDDNISRPDRVKDLYLNCSSQVKELHLIDGQHDSERERPVETKAVVFILRCLRS